MFFHSKELTQNILIKLTYQSEAHYKKMAREHLSLDCLLDSLLMLQHAQGKLLRVPLTTLVSYKGFRALAIAHIELSDVPQVGFHDNDYYTNGELEETL